MAILQKTREKAGMAVSIIIALALLSFIIDPQTLETAFNAMSSKNDVGMINGKTVSYLDFQQDVEKYSTINEILTNSTSQNEQQQESIRNQAWQSLLDRYLFVKNAKAAGINVGEDEMKELLAGDMISPLISQNPAFMDENGNFSKEALQNLVNSIPQDQSGRLKEYWSYLQNTINTQQYYSKYYSLFSQSDIQNPLMLKRSIAENNNTTKVDFVMVPNYGVDTTVKVSSDEIKKYYDSHKKMFKQNASRDMEYVVFEVKPSTSDIEATAAAMNKVYDEFSTTDNVKSFIARNSERNYNEYWYKAGELSTVNKEISDFVDANTTGTSTVVSDNNVFYAARVVATAQIPDSAYVKHILLQGTDAAKADSLLGVIAGGETFSNVASAYSADKNSADEGELGNIGWMTQNYMIPGFESIFTAQTGKPYTIKTQYGTHIVVVSKKSAPVTKKQVAILEKTALPSGETFNSYYAQATKFSKLAAGKYNNYKAAADSMGVYSHPLRITEATSTYGTIAQAKEVTRWVFDNKVGKVSDIMTINNNYLFIAAVTGIHKEGVAKIEEVKDGIRQTLYAEKAAEKAAADIAQKIKGLNDLQTIADTLHTSVSTDVDVRFASLNSQGLDPKFIGVASVAPEGKICGPVAGTVGTYIFKVNSREAESFYTEDDAKAYTAQVNNYNCRMILPVMMQDADVKDNRARFY